MDYIERCKEVLDIEIAALEQLRDRIDPGFSKAVDTIVSVVNNKAKLVVVGVGKSGLIGRKISATFTSTGTPSVVLNSTDALHGDLGIIIDGDAILALSYSGESEEILRLLPVIKRFNVKIIGMTGNGNSALAEASDIVLNVGISREACPFNLAPTASTTVMLALGDALAMAVLSGRGFTKKDFARLHPSGSIGKTLLLRVRDIMRTGKRYAIANADISVKDALLEMTRTKSGCVCVTNKEGRLVGVFTDGDLRRHITKGTTALSLPLSEVMTSRPICIRADSLAAEALRIFNERNIDDLIVVNDQHYPVGTIDSQDLPKLKLT
ncbi:MAG: KpsF/GutQ family sugar-phosphate isomerase [Verrucomicrobia bacterium]|nr:KpsF/GutQ family sugar-phosphate isomerase [Verrucomicrobiota bacterium]